MTWGHTRGKFEPWTYCWSMTTPNLTSLLAEFLRREGFTVEAAHEGNRGLDRALQPGVDLLVLDVMLPGIDGFEILRRLREKSKVPVIMLTARGEDVDRIVGLDLGADDYLAEALQSARTRRPHPRHPAALSAVRRACQPHRDQRHPCSTPAPREVLVHGKRVELTTFEFDILEMLMRSAGRVLSRDALMENFYNRKATPFDRSIDMHISHLRKKLEGGDDLIKTIRGVGYQFCSTPEDAVTEGSVPDTSGS